MQVTDLVEVEKRVATAGNKGVCVVIFYTEQF